MNPACRRHSRASASFNRQTAAGPVRCVISSSSGSLSQSPPWRAARAAGATTGATTLRVMKPSPSVPLRDFAASLELIAEPVVRAALLEDIGRGGDLTSESIVAPERTARGAIVARKGGILAGLDIALRAFAILDAHVQVRTLLCDGDRIEAGAHAAML